MKKKQFQQILRMHKSGVGTLTCVQAILELEPSKIEAAQAIDDFYCGVIAAERALQCANCTLPYEGLKI